MSQSLAKAVIAVFQTLYASFTLYETRGDQIKRYGYAAFGLTVTPYLVMSIINLVGNFLTPTFPSVYLVRDSVMQDLEEKTGKKFHGVVAEVHHSWSSSVLEERRKTFRAAKKRFLLKLRMRTLLLRSAFTAISIAVIGGLTSFKEGHSTHAQRSWLLTWLIFRGLFSGGVTVINGSNFVEAVDSEKHRGRFKYGRVLYLAAYGAPAVGGFVVVAQMLKEYGSCAQLY
jgi:hypothetical protein